MERFDIERKSVVVLLFDMEFVLYERTAEDVKVWEDFLASRKDDLESGDSFVSAIGMFMIIQDALRPNITNLKFWQVIKKQKLKKLFQTRSLLKNLTTNQITECWQKVRKMEGWKPDIESCKECGQQVYKKKVQKEK